MSLGGMSTRFVIFMGVLMVILVAVGIWMVVKPAKAAKLKYYVALQDPDKDELGDFAVGLSRLSGMAILFVVLLVVLALVNPGTEKHDHGDGWDGFSDEQAASSFCRNWDETEYDKVSKAAGDEWDIVVPAAYQANRCSLAFGYGAESLRKSLEAYVDSVGRPDEDSLQKFYVDYLTNEGLLSGWSGLCLRGSERTVDDLSELQQELGKGLAVASQPGTNRINSNWNALRKLGSQKIQLRTYAQPEGVEAWEHTKKFEVDEDGPVVFGWSVLAPLLRFGEFREDFLVPMATSILEFDKRHPRGWTVPGEEWVSFDAKSTDPEIEDAIEPVLEALSRNKGAAKKVAKETGDERVEALLKD